MRHVIRVFPYTFNIHLQIADAFPEYKILSADGDVIHDVSVSEILAGSIQVYPCADKGGCKTKGDYVIYSIPNETDSSKEFTCYELAKESSPSCEVSDLHHHTLGFFNQPVIEKMNDVVFCTLISERKLTPIESSVKVYCQIV